MWQQQTLNPFLGVLQEGPQAAKQAASSSSTSSSLSPATTPNAATGAASVSGSADPSDLAAIDTTVPSDEELEATKTVRLQNEKIDLELSLLGGRIKSLQTKDYRDSIDGGAEGKQLVKHLDSTPYSLGVYSGAVNDQRVNYAVGAQVGFKQSGESDFMTGSDISSLTLVGRLPDGREIQKTISLGKNDYQITVDVKLLAPAPSGENLALEIARYVDPESMTFKDYDSGLVAFDGRGISKTTYGEVSGSASAPEKLSWLAISEKYFTDVIIPRTPNSVISYFQNKNVFFARATGGSTEGSFSIYSGPKDYDLLKSMPDQLHRTVDFGWTSFISVPLMSLLGLLYGIFKNYGVAIVVLTILVKLALYPLNAAQFKSMKAMQDLAPDLKRIRETVTDKQEQQMQMMALYKKKGVNPLGGCLPMLVQLPIFIGLYFGLRVSFALRHQPFAFWINDLSAPEYLNIAGVGVPVMVILMVAAMIFQQQTTPTPSMDPAQKRIMMLMPFMMGIFFFIWAFPAGLTLYWLTSSIISIGQQKGMHSDLKISALKLTLLVSAVTFGIALTLALIGN